ncbi:MAG: hypothetical protein GC181_13905 [Bacteroidetes bacterium]|nr:hypothetical protein [Bacteroidota bacterium]
MKTIKQTIIVLALILSGFSSGFATLDSSGIVNKKWTVSTILVNQSTDVFYDQVFINFFDGLVVKRHFDKISARIGVEYFTNTYKTGDNKCCDWVFAEGYKNVSVYRIGAEKSFIRKGRFQSYLALDAVFQKTHSNLHFYGDYAYPQTITNSTGYGIFTSLGFAYSLSRQLSLGLETRGKFLQTQTKNDYTNYNPWYSERHTESKELIKSMQGIGVFTLDWNF